MVAFPEPGPVEALHQEVRALRDDVRALLEELRTAYVVIDAMRDAWLLPSVEVLLEERRRLAGAEGTTAPPLPGHASRVPPDGQRHVPARALLAPPEEPQETAADRAKQARAANYAAALGRVRDRGRAAAREGLKASDCPYKGAAGGFRGAWLDGHKAESRAAAGVAR